MQAYEAVTTKGGAYVQGGGCTTVGVAGLVQRAGFGSFSKHYGTAAAALLEAEVVTADGQICIANRCTNPELFWALKGGGGGSFGVVSKLTLRVRELPEVFGGADFVVKAASDSAYRKLLRKFIGFYRENLFNQHWGEEVHVRPDNSLAISMVSWNLDTESSNKAWQTFLEWLGGARGEYTVHGGPVIGAVRARGWWDVDFWRALHASNYVPDSRSGAAPFSFWWKGDSGQVAWFIYGFESLWLPASLLHDLSQEKLADALFAASRYSRIELHFNKGLAGAPREAIAAASETATNPVVLDAFALAIAADGGGGYPGIGGTNLMPTQNGNPRNGFIWRWMSCGGWRPTAARTFPKAIILRSVGSMRTGGEITGGC